MKGKENKRIEKKEIQTERNIDTHIHHSHTQPHTHTHTHTHKPKDYY